MTYSDNCICILRSTVINSINSHQQAATYQGVQIGSESVVPMQALFSTTKRLLGIHAVSTGYGLPSTHPASEAHFMAPGG
jgi:hypothetical protein